MSAWRIAAGLLLALIVTTSAANKVGAQGFPPGTFRIAGMPVGCGPVWTILQTGIGDAARAIPGGPHGPPAIVLDPYIVGKLPPVVQLFIYAHECAHHVIGLNENAADCWAAKLGRRQGWFEEEDMEFLVQVFGWNPGDWTHAPGHIRLQNIWNCYNSN